MRKVGIDLGTTNLLICVDNEGIVIDEPSILTIDAQTKKCIAAGKEAKEMLGRTPAQHDLHQSAEGRGHCRF